MRRKEGDECAHILEIFYFLGWMTDTWMLIMYFVCTVLYVWNVSQLKNVICSFRVFFGDFEKKRYCWINHIATNGNMGKEASHSLDN